MLTRTLTVVAALLLGASAQAASYRIIYSFNDFTSGAEPVGLSADASGNLYGATTAGGLDDCGTAFQLVAPAADPTPWTYQNIHTFECSDPKSIDGAYPASAPTVGPNGYLYGVTPVGGGHPSKDSGRGTLWTANFVDGAWNYETLVRFGPEAELSLPVGGVAVDSAGNIYGAASGGGAGRSGGIYEVASRFGPTPLQQTTLHAFSRHKGLMASGTPVLTGDDDFLTGFVENADTVACPNCGGLYEVAIDGPAYGVRTRTGLTTGGVLSGPLVMPNHGVIFTDTQGGSGVGAVEMLAPSAPVGGTWTLTTLYAFSTAGGYAPSGGVVRDGNGSLFGVTTSGGANGAGQAYRLDPPTDGGAWTYTDLHDFGATEDGAAPVGPLVFGSKHRLYGVMTQGSVSGFGGVFELGVE